MEMKDKIKLRRQERIKGLMQDKSRHIPAIAVDEPSGRATEMEETERDPEKAWNLRNPWLPPEKPGGRQMTLIRNELILKLVISLVIFIGIAGMFKLDAPLAKQGQAFVQETLTSEMNFEAVAAWYHNNFSGSPVFIPIFGRQEEAAQRANGPVRPPVFTPVEGGMVVRSFAELLNGVEIAATGGSQVRAVETGRVLLVSRAAEEGQTIVIQHANKRLSVYGKLSSPLVSQNDWIEGGQPIGQVMDPVDGSPGLLYFAVKENDHYVDPMDVVAFE